MKLKIADNGNVVAVSQRIVSSNANFNRNWVSNNDFNTCNTNQLNTQFEFEHSKLVDNVNNLKSQTNTADYSQDACITSVICNRQYRLNAENEGLFLESLNDNQLAHITDTALSKPESFKENTHVSARTANVTRTDYEKSFDHSDTDEMSDNSAPHVPRGIVNRNYPGFQHLAHTLQDYSANIENFYPSENEMTDDDVDLEMTDSNYEPETNQNDLNYNNNNNNDEKIETIKQTVITDFHNQPEVIESRQQDEIPDLLKTVANNNNNSIITAEFDTSCFDTDIENNFNTKDIIGDFNKEIEDEIKQLLNYNINIQDDLEELRKDIKDTFAKPIENTINNISDVVNHVIKKLVKTHSDTYEINDNLLSEENKSETKEEFCDFNKENETNTRTEMNLSRPTLMLIENDAGDVKIADAFLSDAKDEIKVYGNEYDTELLTNNVEKTIQQLSRELRKIIPKLDEMRETDQLWTNKKVEVSGIKTDRNLNEVASSKRYSCIPPSNSEHLLEVNQKPIFSQIQPVNRRIAIATRIETRPMMRERPRTINSTGSSHISAQSNTSVRKNIAAGDCDLDSFDVYNIETALPKLDLDAIESHLKAAKEAERRKRNDREEIRKRLAMGAEADEYYSMGHIERPGKKPSLHSRLQNGMNLQVCYMNETASDNESQALDVERNPSHNKTLTRSNIFTKSNFNHPYQTRPLSVNITKHDKVSMVQSGTKLRPSTFSSKPPKSRSAHSLGQIELKESDFHALQATLQTEARIALAQAKELARIQMERERRSAAVSPVTEMLRRSMAKANAPLAPDRRRVSRQLLTDMNVAQLQVIVNELHSQIECLNESLVALLMGRDELHMSQDSMLVDIEDLTRYLGVKEQTKKTKGPKSGVRRLASLVHK